MAANVEIIESARIAANGGPITSDRYKCDADGADATNDLAKGELCTLTAGEILPVRTSAGVVNTSGAPFNAAAQYFVSLADVDVTATAAAYVAVQEVTADTVFEGYVVDSGSGGDVTMDQTDIGKKYPAYVDANGRFAIDNVDNTAPVAVIVDVDDVYEPYQMGGDFEEDSTGVRHQRVKFSLLSALIA